MEQPSKCKDFFKKISYLKIPFYLFLTITFFFIYGSIPYEKVEYLIQYFTEIVIGTSSYMIYGTLPLFLIFTYFREVRKTETPWISQRALELFSRWLICWFYLVLGCKTLNYFIFTPGNVPILLIVGYSICVTKAAFAFIEKDLNFSTNAYFGMAQKTVLFTHGFLVLIALVAQEFPVVEMVSDQPESSSAQTIFEKRAQRATNSILLGMSTYTAMHGKVKEEIAIAGGIIAGALAHPATHEQAALLVETSARSARVIARNLKKSIEAGLKDPGPGPSA